MSSCFVFQLYESALSENQKLKSKLQEAQLELADIKAKLEKAAQVRENPGPDGETEHWPRQTNTCSRMGKGGKLLEGCFWEGRCNRENRSKQVILQINLLHPKQDHLWAVLAFVQHKHHKHPVSALGFNHFLFLISIPETGENF